ncbi:MAG: F420-0--gamma-glutamyl ligase [Patescibacteria group bacterium]
MDFIPNQGKNLILRINGKSWSRIPIKTHFITVDDNLDDIIEKYVLPLAQNFDIIALGQKIVSILQKRVVYEKDIRVGFWAKFFSKFAIKTPYGFSVGNPKKMQIAINSAGLWRILLAGFCNIFFKLFGVSGMFYRIAGNQINQIDGFYGEAFPQYLKMGILGPKNGNALCQALNKKYQFSFLIADVNDLGGNILGRSQDLEGKERMMLEILKDNPAGQQKEQTPLIILRRANY